MRRKCKSLIKAGIVAAIASSPFGVPAQAGNIVHDSEFITDRNVPSVPRKDGSAAISLLDELTGGTDRNSTRQSGLDSPSNLKGSAPNAPADSRGFVIRANSIAAPSDYDTAAVLGATGFVLDEFLNPSTGISENNPINSAVVDIRDVESLGGTRGDVDLDPIQMLGPVSVNIATYGNTGSSNRFVPYGTKVSPKIVQNFKTIPNKANEYQDQPTVL